MATVGFLVRTSLRRRLGAVVVLAALLGLAFGASMAAWAGARRTESAYPRLLEATDEGDVTISSFGFTDIDLDAIGDAPGVRAVGGMHGYGTGLRTGDESDIGSFFAIAPVDRTAARSMSRPIVEEGRLPDPEEPDEVLISEDTVALGYGVGSTIPTCIFTFDEVESFEPREDEVTEEELNSICPSFPVEVVGVGRFAFEINADENEAEDPVLLFSPAFNRAAPKTWSYDLVLVDLVDPARDFGAFQRAVLAAHPGGQLIIEQRELSESSIQHSVRPYTSALQLFALVAAITSIGVLLPALRRSALDDDATDAGLIAAGVTPVQRRLAQTSRAAITGLVGAVIAVMLAIVASSRFPVGPARIAEPDTGIHVDVLVVTVGAVAVFALAAAAGLARRRTRMDRGNRRPSSFVASVARAGAPPTAVLGLSAAVSGHAEGTRSSTAVTLAGTAVSVVTVAAALTFGASLTRLLDEPARYGWTWDAAFEAFEGGIGPGQLDLLAESDQVTGMSIASRAAVPMNDRTVFAFAFDPRKGDIAPSILEGRYPTDDDEVALGRQTLERVGGLIGGELVATDGRGRPHVLRIVGRTLVPALALGQRVGVGEGALVTLDALDTLADPEEGIVLLDLAPGATPKSLRQEFLDRGLPEPGGLTGATKSGDLVSYERVDRTPLALAGLLALLGTGVLAHSLGSSIRSRRRELAVLKCLGFGRRQVAATVGWHATAVAVTCLVVGLPVGIAVGRVAWTGFADGLGVDPDPALPVLALSLLAVGGLVVANVVAAVPGWWAGRTAPALALHHE